MSTELFIYAGFMIPLFFIGAFLLTGLPIAMNVHDYYRNRRQQRPVTRPDSRETAGATVDRHRLATVK